MKNTFVLSKKEKEFMELFWEAGCPLAREEVLARAALRKCTWKPNSFHILVNSLLKKGALKVAGYHINSRKLGRDYAPAITPEEYAAMLVVNAAAEAAAVLGKEPEWTLPVLQAVGKQ